MFKISDKVVRVDDANQGNETVTTSFDPVRLGVTYVVRGFSSQAGVYLVGMFGGLWRDGEEAGWNQRRFRKLSDIKAENALKRTETAPATAPNN